jgi:hypothetical protein
MCATGSEHPPNGFGVTSVTAIDPATLYSRLRGKTKMRSIVHEMSRPANVEHEFQLQRAVMAYIVTGIIFMLLPGTFLGVWNLVSISNQHQLESLSPAWIQAHGHAQLYGWIGTFVIGIGFYSLSKMGALPRFAIRRAWFSYALWTGGVLLRWSANVTGWHWKVALPVSAILELAGFLCFFATVSHHKAGPDGPRKPRKAWMLAVVIGSCGFLLALLLNLFATCETAWSASSPAISAVLDQRLLAIPVWTFLVPTVWGFNARWLPVFLGLRPPNGRQLLSACGIAWAGALSTLAGHTLISALMLLSASALAMFALHIFHKAEKPAKTTGVPASFSMFVKAAYIWLGLAGALTIWAAAADHAGGIWGASRHAITVGFLGAMVFAIGPRILPALCGARVLFSRQLMLASVVLLNVGCALRVMSEIPAYEGFAAAQLFWRILPVSAVIELVAVTVFAANLIATFCQPPAHLVSQKSYSRQGLGLS